MQQTKVITVDEYFERVEPVAKQKLQQVRELIQELVPEAIEVVSYGVPAFKLPGRGRAFVYFAGYAKHLSVYPVPDVSSELAEFVKAHRTGRGTLRFALDQPLPLALIKQVIVALKKRQQLEEAA